MHDVMIIGAGVAGVFAAYRLSQTGKKILLIDKGPDLPERLAKLAANPQIQYQGFGGLGLSEGKYNYSHQFGGSIAGKIGADKTMSLMREVDDILCRFGGKDATFYHTENPQLQQQCRAAGLEMISTSVRHLGTEKSKAILTSLRNYMADKADFIFNCEPQKLSKTGEYFELTVSRNQIKETLSARNVVIAAGNSPSAWLQKQMAEFNIEEGQTRLDLGLRIEMPYRQWHSLLSRSFETKLRLEYDGRSATTYCMNPGGRIIRKYEKGLVMPDGQNCNESETASENLNFTLFVSDYFAGPAQALAYGQNIISAINQNADRIVVQRLGDLKRNCSTVESDMTGNEVKPSLSASCGNLTDWVPQHYLDITLEFFNRLSRLLGEEVSEDTLLYALDAKFFAASKVISADFETATPGLFLAGDCSGVTGSLSQAAVSGLHIANYLNQYGN